MCECGCVESDLKYSFPGPGKSFYLLTLSRGCVSCDAPSGVSIELIEPGMFMHRKESRENFIDGELHFEDWSDSKGVAIITGMCKDEFIKAMMQHLVGVSSEEMGENGRIDDAGADVIADEMYEDAVVKPHFPADVTC